MIFFVLFFSYEHSTSICFVSVSVFPECSSPMSVSHTRPTGLLSAQVLSAREVLQRGGQTNGRYVLGYCCFFLHLVTSLCFSSLPSPAFSQVLSGLWDANEGDTVINPRQFYNIFKDAVPYFSGYRWEYITIFGCFKAIAWHTYQNCVLWENINMSQCINHITVHAWRCFQH